MKSSVLILDNIRSTYNVGAIFRTADAAGISKIYLVGVTAGPIDRFGRSRKDIAKVALGAEKSVPFEHRENMKELLRELKIDGYQIIAIEQSENSVDYKKIEKKEKVAIVMGTEVEGLSEEILDECDIVAEIPMQGKLAREKGESDQGKESLNVSVVTGIALFRLLGL